MTEYGSFCPWCKHAVRAQKDRRTGLLWHISDADGRKEEHWWGVELGGNRDAAQGTLVEGVRPTTGAFGYCQVCHVSVPVQRRGEVYAHEFSPGMWHIIQGMQVRQGKRVVLLDVKQSEESEWRKAIMDRYSWDEAYAPIQKPRPEEAEEDEGT